MNSSSNNLRRALLVPFCAVVLAAVGEVTVSPDYFNIEVPPNIAPLNFDVKGVTNGTPRVTFRAPDGDALTAKGPAFRFPPRRWRAFLEKHRGEALVGTLVAGETTICSFTNRVSRFPIPSHLTYRLVQPLYSNYKVMGIYQRDLTTFKEKPLYHNLQESRPQCVNCHTYNNGDPKQYLFHTRVAFAGTQVVSAKYGRVKILPKLPNDYPFGVYPAWHPSGDYIVFSCNDTFQKFYSFDLDKVEVMDAGSDLFLYGLKDGKVTMIEEGPTLFECFPTWSPDGKFLVTSSARSPFGDIPIQQMPEQYDKVRYDLSVRTFDEKTLSFSPRRILVNAITSKMSFTFPRISPDGRWLVFTAGPYGVFSIWHRTADLWVFDFRTGDARALNELNSPAAESYHCFASNGRWMVFSSRRDDGVYTRPYFAAFDPATGRFSKPFILPVEDPAEHMRRFLSYNIPEFSDGPVRESPRQLRKLVESVPREAASPEPFKLRIEN